MPGHNLAIPARFHCTRSAFYLIIMVVGLLVCSPVYAAWQSPQYFNQTVTGSAVSRWWKVENPITTSSQSAINDIIVDSQNGIVTAGRIDSGAANTSVNLYVSRHDSGGALLWDHTYDGGYYDEAVFVGQDGNGDILVVGSSDTATTTGIVVCKYNLATGAAVWSNKCNQYNVSGSLTDPKAVIGPNNEVFVAVTHDTGIYSKEIELLRVDVTGTVTQWGSTYQAPGGGVAQAVDIALSPADNTVVVAGTSDEQQSKDIVVLKYNIADGTTPTAWSGGIRPASLYGGFDSNDYASALFVNQSSGQVYVAGRMLADCTGVPASPGRHNMVVYTLDAGAAKGWNAPGCYISNSGWVIPNDITVDGSGNVYVGGQDGLDTSADTLLISFDASGSRRWIDTRDNGPGDTLNELVISAAGDIFGIGSGNGDILLVHYAADGTFIGMVTDDYGARENANAIAVAQDVYSNSAIIIGATSVDDAKNDGRLIIQGYAMMKADIFPDAVSAPSVGGYDSTILINTSVSNTKSAASQLLSDTGSFVLGLYLWPDGAGTPTGPSDPGLIPFVSGGQRTIPSLPAGQQDNNSGNGTAVVVPNNIAQGFYRVVLIADINGSIPEYDTSNNVLVDTNTIEILDPPDLQATAVSVPGSVVLPAASSLSIDYTIQDNRSVAPSQNFDVGFYLSQNTTIGDSDDIPLTGVGTVTAGSLLGNSTYSGTANNIIIPNTVPPGDYHLIAKADVNDVIVESYENNNSFMGSTILTVQAIPDLFAQDVRGTLSGVVGDPYSADVDLSNDAGTSDITQPFDVSIYLSTDNVITTGDQLLGTQSVAGVTANGQIVTVTVNGTVPSGLAAGTYYLGAIVDVNNSITENDETNNTVVSASQVVIGLPATDPSAQPELIVNSVSAGTTSLTRGTTVSVATTVANILPKDIPNTAAGGTSFRVGVYLSTDTNITASDYFIGSRMIDGLTGNTTSSSSDNMSIPSETYTSVTWANIYQAHVSGTSLISDSSAGTAGAMSSAPIATDDVVEFTVANTNILNFGLAPTASSPYDIVDYKHAFVVLSTGHITIIDRQTDGTAFNFDAGTFAVGDKLRIQRLNGEVTYWQNGQKIYTSLNPYTGSLYLVAKLNNLNSTVQDANYVKIDLPVGNYYLGAIVDDTSVITEVDETNNAQVQTDGSGNASLLVVSVVNGNNSSRGGGSLEMADLLILLLLSLYSFYAGRRLRQRRQFSPR